MGFGKVVVLHGLVAHARGDCTDVLQSAIPLKPLSQFKVCSPQTQALTLSRSISQCLSPLSCHITWAVPQTTWLAHRLQLDPIVPSSPSTATTGDSSDALPVTDAVCGEDTDSMVCCVRSLPFPSV